MLTSTSGTKVKQIVNWQNKAKERRKDNIFLVEGIKMFLEAPTIQIRDVYLSEELLEKCQNGQESKGPEILEKLSRTGYEVVSGEVYEKISDTQTPQGILVVMDRPEYTVEQLLDVPNPLLVILEGIQDPGNLGTIVRTAEGAGASGIVMSPNTVDIYNPKTIRSTMGSIYRVPFIYVDDLQDTLLILKRKGVKLYAAHLKGQKEYDEFSYQGGTGFLIGNEGNGLKKETADLADSYLRIPMEGQLESLNAAVATALLLYEAHRQRK